MHYKTVLENEVPVTQTYITELFRNKEVFVLGYGSLLYSSGWMQRGMGRVPSKADLTECTVKGYERGPYGIYYPVGRKHKHYGIHFYGVVPNDSCFFNGVLVKIHSMRDWINLMVTECIAGMTDNYNYRCVDVTDSIRGVKLGKNKVVHMVVNEPHNKSDWQMCGPAPRYYDRVATGVRRERSDKFKRMFYSTGGYSLEQARIMYKSARILGRGRYI